MKSDEEMLGITLSVFKYREYNANDLLFVLEQWVILDTHYCS